MVNRYGMEAFPITPTFQIMKHSPLSINDRLITRVAAIALVLGTIALESGVAQAVTFISSGTKTPKNSTGGASRGMNFVPKGSAAPKTSTGGASRGILFKPTGGPSRATGGASRGTLFQPNRTKIWRSVGGASRGKMFSSGSAPTHTSGGASRDGSMKSAALESTFPASLMALVPQEFAGNTLESHPTFMVYMPESNAEEAIFSLKDEAGNLIYQTVLPISGEAGVAKVQLPSSVPALEVGKNYQWLTALVVDGRLTPSTPYVDGWIQRIAATSETSKAMAQRDPIVRAQSLATLGIWYDTAATLASLREAQPDNESSLKNWQELLTSVGLKDIQSVPMLQYQ